MGLKTESRTLSLSQGEPDKDIKIVIKTNIAEFRRANNDSLLFIMTGEECFSLTQEFYPNLVQAP